MKSWLQKHLHNLYIHGGGQRLHYFLKFLFHRYGPEQFDVQYIKGNFHEIAALIPGQWIQANRHGKLELIKSRNAYLFFRLKNILLFGAPQARVEKTLYFTYLTYCLEVYNPFNRKLLKDFVRRKKEILKRMLDKQRKVNDREWKGYIGVLQNLSLFERGSLLQDRVIKGMENATKGEAPPIVADVKEALRIGLFPLLVIQGLSGTYWMRGTDKEIAGLFKPFDEEAYAPNNPGGPAIQGALGQRRMRPGIRVGECAHREVAAYIVDEFFSFGIVPKTYYARFSHHAFFQAIKESERGLQRKIRDKMGSFQEYIAGFITLNDLPPPEWKHLPTVELQLLVLLDVITGNCDRNTGNILVGEEKIAAIDHGLCFSDINYHLSTWYWKIFEQLKNPFPESMVTLLRDFPFDKLLWRLRKRCHIDLGACERLRERVMLFREGILQGKTPAELADLFSDENLAEIYNAGGQLPEKVKEIALRHFTKTD